MNSALATAQVATSDTLVTDEVTVTSTRIHRSSELQPVYRTKIDSVQIASRRGEMLGSLLRSLPGVHVRSNGPGAASILSHRGLGGSRVSIEWEGIPLNHSMLGVADLSIVSNESVGAVDFSSGSGSSYSGSGIGSVISLSSPDDVKGLTLNEHVNTMGNTAVTFSGGVAGQSWKTFVLAGYRKDDNRFRYYDEAGDQVSKRKHAAGTGSQLMTVVQGRRGNAGLKSSFWWNKADHEVPENIYAGPGSAHQYDESFRWSNRMVLRRPGRTVRTSFHLSSVRLDYFNSRAGINSLSTSRSIGSDFSVSHSLKNMTELKYGASMDYILVTTSNFPEDKYRLSSSVFVNAAWEPLEGLSIYPSVSWNYFSEFENSVTYSAGMNYVLLPDDLFIRINYSGDYRVPTFNDLYWPDGGNASLEPEEAKRLEAGLTYKKAGKIPIRTSLSMFYTDLDKGIKWLPDEGGRFKAGNIQQLISRGVEWTGSTELSAGLWKIHLNNTITYNRVFIDEQRFKGDSSTGNQLPYEPLMSWSGNFRFSRGDWFAGVSSQFAGDRYATEEGANGPVVDSYIVTDLTAGTAFDIGDFRMLLSGRAGNIFDERYSVIRYFPMPLRNFSLNISINYKP